MPKIAEKTDFLKNDDSERDSEYFQAGRGRLASKAAFNPFVKGLEEALGVADLLDVVFRGMGGTNVGGYDF